MHHDGCWVVITVDVQGSGLVPVGDGDGGVLDTGAHACSHGIPLCVGDGVDGGSVDADFPVQVVARAGSGGADVADELALSDFGAGGACDT